MTYAPYINPIPCDYLSLAHFGILSLVDMEILSETKNQLGEELMDQIKDILPAGITIDQRRKQIARIKDYRLIAPDGRHTFDRHHCKRVMYCLIDLLNQCLQE